MGTGPWLLFRRTARRGQQQGGASKVQKIQGRRWRRRVATTLVALMKLGAPKKPTVHVKSGVETARDGSWSNGRRFCAWGGGNL